MFVRRNPQLNRNDELIHLLSIEGLPRSSGTFFTSRSLTERNVPAVSRMWCSTVRGSPSIDSRCTSSS